MENSAQGNSAVFLKVRTPYPTITKGAVSCTDSKAIFSQVPAFPYTADFASCPPISSVVPASSAVFNSDITNLTGGDYVTFVITITNQGIIPPRPSIIISMNTLGLQ